MHAKTEVNPIQFKVIRNGLLKVTEEMAIALLEFMPRSHFTVEELDTLEAKVERGKPLLSPLAYKAIKAGIGSKRLTIAS